MIDILPSELVDRIVSSTDIFTIPYLKATCKTVSNQITSECYNKMVANHIKRTFEDVITVVKQYHNALTNKDTEDKLFKMLSFQILNGDPNPKLTFGTFIIFKACEYITFAESATVRSIKQTWMKYANGIPLDDNENALIKDLQDFVVGTDKSVYIVTFNFIDRKTNKTSHYCVINLQFHDTGDIQLNFSIEDTDVRKFTYISSEDTFQRSVRSTKMIVSDTTLTELADCIVDALGRETCLSKINVVDNIDKWVGPFTKYAEKMFDNIANILISPESYREEIIRIFSKIG